VRAFGLSDTGPVRKVNEDTFISDPEFGLFAVADGMGGHAAGEVASRLAIEAAQAFIRRSRDSMEISWPCGLDRQLSLDGNRLKTAVHLANRRVFRAAESHDDYTGMGTTIAAVLIGSTKVSIAHVGDSRIYHYAAGTLECLTEDDSWAATILQDPNATPKTLAAHPLRHVLTNVLGARDQTEIHVKELPRESAETLLLCSDGLHGVVDDEALRAILLQHAEPEDAARSLVEAALQARTRDNVTALVIRCTDGV
jgi:serine/threonine protein phosphatase PrpC